MRFAKGYSDKLVRAELRSAISRTMFAPLSG